MDGKPRSGIGKNPKGGKWEGTLRIALRPLWGVLRRGTAQLPGVQSTERTPPVLKPVWPIHVPRPQPEVPAQEKILAGLAVINQELLATPSPGMTMARAT